MQGLLTYNGVAADADATTGVAPAADAVDAEAVDAPDAAGALGQIFTGSGRHGSAMDGLQAPLRHCLGIAPSRGCSRCGCCCI